MIPTINTLRADLLALEMRCRSLRAYISQEAKCIPELDVPELQANVMLTIRHVEDARMRLGKGLQVINGGSSCYDQAAPGGTPK